jgi:hypothetical protein
MKKSTDYLRNTGVKEKSQVIAESQARHLSLVSNGPNVLFSVLTDCCCLYVLVHFRKEKRAYLSHREIEPGRMIAVLAWLQKQSTLADLTEQEFLQRGFAIGEPFEAEISDAVDRKRAGSATTNPVASINQKPHGDGAGFAGAKSNHALDVVDVTAADDKEKQDIIHSQVSTFSAFQNHYHWGCDLPMTEGVLGVLERSHRGVHGDNNKTQAGLQESIQRMHDYSDAA